MKLSSSVLIPPLVIASLMVSGFLVERSRSLERSRLSGTFEHQPTLVSSRVPGRVRKILVSEGAGVDQGQLVLQLETDSLSAEVEALQRQALQARAHYDLIAAGPRPEDIQRQESLVAELQAQLDKLSNGPRPEEIASARAQYDKAAAIYQKVQKGPRSEEIERLRAQAERERQKLRLAQSELKRHSLLFREGAMSRQEFERVETEARVAESNVMSASQALQEALRGNRSEDRLSARADMESAHQQWNLLAEGSRQEDLRSAQARLDQARAILTSMIRGSRPQEVAEARSRYESAILLARSAAQKLKENQVKAPLGGKVERILVAEGDLVPANAPLLRLSQPENLWLRVYLPQAQLAKVKPGDGGELQVDGLDQKLACKVEAIASEGEFTPANLQTPEERGQQVFAVRLRLSQPDTRVKAGMMATVRQLGGWP